MRELYEAIFKRKSVRKYAERQLSKEDIAKIEEVITQIEPLDETIDLRVHLVKDGQKVQNIMRGLIGNVGKISAPHYLVVTSEAKEGYWTNAGYAIEKIVLELTTMGIANCWLGGHVKDEAVQDLLGLPKTQKAVVLISLGYPLDDAKAVREDVSEFKRKDLSEIVIGSFDDSWLEIFEAARLAPSAGNTQPWRFVQQAGQIDVYCAEGKNFMTKKLFGEINKLDVGIALFHIKLATDTFGQQIRFVNKHLESPDKMVYITSIEG